MLKGKLFRFVKVMSLMQPIQRQHQMGTTVAVCISQQSYASIAAKHGMKAAEVRRAVALLRCAFVPSHAFHLTPTPPPTLIQACGRLATALKSLG